MTLIQQICKCGNHEITGGGVSTFGGFVAHPGSGGFSNLKILLKDYRFNVHYLVGRNEWDFRQFESAKEATDFCRQLEITQIFKIFHQISASINGKSETVARRINLRACEQMTNDKTAFQQNNTQTAYKLALKIWNSTRRTAYNRMEQISGALG